MWHAFENGRFVLIALATPLRQTRIFWLEELGWGCTLTCLLEGCNPSVILISSLADHLCSINVQHVLLRQRN